MAAADGAAVKITRKGEGYYGKIGIIDLSRTF